MKWKMAGNMQVYLAQFNATDKAIALELLSKI